MAGPKLSAVVSIRNEEDRIVACLEKLSFADEIVVVLDRCTDNSKAVVSGIADKTVDGAWEREGDRRNAAIAACNGEWILEVDADEHVTAPLAEEIRRVIDAGAHDWYEIPVDNYIGDRLVRHGWGASYGKAAYPGLFRRGIKSWGSDRVHPRLTWTGNKGPMLEHRVNHYVDRGISDMIKRLDSYSTARAIDLHESGDIGRLRSNLRRFFSRFLKCYLFRKGYREGGYGFLIAVFAGLYPLLAYLKARELEGKR